MHTIAKPRPNYWALTDAERKILHTQFGRVPMASLMAQLGRTRFEIRRTAYRIGCDRCRRRCPQGEALAAFLAAKAALGWCDRHIAADYSRQWPDRVPVERHALGFRRRDLGVLACPNGSCPLCRERARATLRRQCEQAGVASLGEIRALAFLGYARRHGWPEDLRPRAVQILDALAERGPMTKAQIAEAIGMPWRGRPSRRILKSRDQEGSYLAHLVKRGLVIQLGRVYGKRYQWHMVYSLSLATQRSFA